MGLWTGWPITAGQDIQDFSLLIQPFYATAEKFKVIGAGVEHWPPSTDLYGNTSGTVETLTHVSGNTWRISDSTKNFHIPADGCDVPWLDAAVTCVEVVDAPPSWDLIFDAATESHHTVFRGHITTWTADTIDITIPIDDYITANYLEFSSELEGRTYYIVPSSGQATHEGNFSDTPRRGIWFHERLPEKPNDRELWLGIATAGSTTTVTQDRIGAGWVENCYAGKEVMVRDSTGRLQRLEILSNTRDTLTFAAIGSAVTGQFAVVEPGARYYPKHPRWKPFQWYAGKTENYLTHNPDDSTGDAPIPKLAITYQVGEVGFCEDDDFDLFDVDLIRETSFCAGVNSNRFENPNVPKSFRHLQNTILAICGSFIEAKDYEGVTAIPPNFVPATLFKCADINWTETTTGSADGDGSGIAITEITLPHAAPIQVYYALFDGDALTKWGTATADSATHLEGGTWDEDDEGLGLVISFGWTRYVVREFRRMFDKTTFEPDLDPEAEEPTPIDPPQEPDAPGGEGPGQWVTRPASTHYVRHEIVSGDSSHDADEIEDGDIARYAGDQSHEPSIIPAQVVGFDVHVLTPYYEKFFTGTRRPPTQRRIDESRDGFASGGTTRQIQDDSKDWHDTDFYTGGEALTATGTFTAGSTTTGTVTTTSDFFDTARNDGRYVGHAVQVQIGATWHHRLITSHTGTTLTWADPLPSTADGMAFNIFEPSGSGNGGELNRWKGRAVRIVRPDPENPGEFLSSEATIAANDATTLFLTAELPFAVSAHMAYKILDPAVGTVWLRQSGEWVKPVGADSRFGGGTFREDARCNHPDVVLRFGAVMKGDALAFNGGETLNQIYRALNCLWQTKQGVSWRSREDMDVPEDNSIEYGGTGSEQSGSGVLIERMKNYADAALDDYPTPNGAIAVGELPTAAPSKSVGLSIGQDAYTAGKASVYSYAWTTAATLLPSDADLYVYTAIGPGDPDNDPYEGCPDLYGSEFSDFGDGLQWRQFHKIDTGDFAETLQTPIRVSEKIGSWDTLSGVWPDENPCDQNATANGWTAPDFDPCPPECDPAEVGWGSGTNISYAVIDQFAVMKWQMQWLP